MPGLRDYGNVRRQAIYIANTATDPSEAMDACLGHYLRSAITPRDFLVLIAAVEDVTGWRVGKSSEPRRSPIGVS